MAAAQMEIDQLRGRVDRLEREAAERKGQTDCTRPEVPYVIERFHSGPSTCVLTQFLVKLSDERHYGGGRITTTWTTSLPEAQRHCSTVLAKRVLEILQRDLGEHCRLTPVLS